MSVLSATSALKRLTPRLRCISYFAASLHAGGTFVQCHFVRVKEGNNYAATRELSVKGLATGTLPDASPEQKRQLSQEESEALDNIQYKAFYRNFKAQKKLCLEVLRGTGRMSQFAFDRAFQCLKIARYCESKAETTAPVLRTNTISRFYRLQRSKPCLDQPQPRWKARWQSSRGCTLRVWKSTPRQADECR